MSEKNDSAAVQALFDKIERRKEKLQEKAEALKEAMQENFDREIKDKLTAAEYQKRVMSFYRGIKDSPEGEAALAAKNREGIFGGYDDEFGDEF